MFSKITPEIDNKIISLIEFESILNGDSDYFLTKQTVTLLNDFAEGYNYKFKKHNCSEKIFHS